MKADELMIGDTVTVNRSECVADGGQYVTWKQDGKIILIEKDYVRVQYEVDDGDDWDDWEEVGLEDIEPIPITKEILEKNGFVIKKKLAQMGNFGNSPLIMWHFEDEPILRHFKHELEIHQNDTGKVHIHIPCEYVHQLQHALRLCGIDKTIKL